MTTTNGAALRSPLRTVLTSLPKILPPSDDKPLSQNEIAILSLALAQLAGRCTSAGWAVQVARANSRYPMGSKDFARFQRSLNRVASLIEDCEAVISDLNRLVRYKAVALTADVVVPFRGIDS